MDEFDIEYIIADAHEMGARLECGEADLTDAQAASLMIALASLLQALEVRGHSWQSVQQWIQMNNTAH